MSPEHHDKPPAPGRNTKGAYPMKSQTRSSAATSINKDRLPAVYGRFDFKPGTIVLDYGCGRYTDHIMQHLADQLCAGYFPYDPYNQPAAANAAALFNFEKLAAETDLPPVVVCSNVLNVIDAEDALQAVAEELLRFVQCYGARALVTVYEGDRSGRGRETGPDQWQRNEKLREYLRLFGSRARIHKNTIVIE